MQVGTLCKVIVHDTHTTDHYGDFVIVLEPANRVYSWSDKYRVCFNPRTNEQHHYHNNELEVLCK